MKKYLVSLLLSFCFFSNSFAQILLQESFDAAGFPPTGWYNTRMLPSFSSSTDLWERVTSGTAPDVTPHSGAGMARFNSPVIPSFTETELGTLPLNFSGGARFRIRFWMYRSDLINAFDELNLYVSTSPSAAFGTKIGTISTYRTKAPDETANGWYEYVYDVPANFTFANSYVIFRAVGKHALPIYIDDVVVETITCHKPVSPTASSNATTTATLSWTAPAIGTPAGYEWEIRTAGSAGSGATGLVQNGTTAAGETSVNVSSLTAGSNYRFYVRSTCGSVKSTWTDLVTFKTQCTAYTVPYTENFDGNLTVTNTCTNVENVNGGYAWTIVSNTYLGITVPSSPNVAYVQFGGSGILPQDDWLYLAPIQLETGKCYELGFSYRSQYTNFPTSFEVKFGTSPKSSAMGATTIYSKLSFIDVNFKTGTGTFTVAQSGIYFIGFHHIGSDGGSLILDDVTVKESIGIPQGINANLSVNSTVLNWSGPNCGTATDYEWELRTTGAAGSGASGLLSTGSGNVLTTTFTGLTEGTNYTFYIRAKNGAFISAWSNAFVFQTKCDIRSLPYSENFDAVTAPAKPSCTLTDNPIGGNPWVNVGNSLAHSAPNCMRIQYNSPSGNQLDGWFFTPPFNFEAGKSYRLTFWYRAHIVYSTEKLEVKYGQGSTAAAMTSTPLFYNSALTTSYYQQHVVDFVPATTGATNIGFHGFSGPGGNDYIRIDDITVSETPLCDSIRNAKAQNITSSAATINWTSPLYGSPTGYTWELRTSGAAGSGATGLINSGSIAAGANSQALAGLLPSTAYQFYIRSNCGATTGSWQSVAFSSSCLPVAIPYTENFDAVTAPQFPSCYSEEDKVDDAKWKILNNQFQARSAPNSMWHDFNPWSPVDDWFYTLPLQLTAGKSYKLSFYYNTMATTTYSEALEIKLGSLAQSSAMTGTALYSATNLKSSTYQLITVDFTAPTTGVWYLGFHSFSSYSQGGITIDDLSVTENITTAVNNVVNADQLIVQQVFPNPVGNKLNLLVNPAKDFGIMKAVIRDNSGRVVKTVNLQLNGSRTYSVLLQGLQPGLYFVETLHEKTGILSKHKVIKQ